MGESRERTLLGISTMQRRQFRTNGEGELNPVEPAAPPSREVVTDAIELDTEAARPVHGKQDPFGRTLEQGLAADRRYRARILRRARKVVQRMRTCDSVARAAVTVARRSWDPFTWLINNLVPRSFAAFAGMALLFCCGCGLPLLHLIAGVAAIFLSLGVFATVCGGLTWLVAVATRKLLSWYLKWLVPW